MKLTTKFKDFSRSASLQLKSFVQTPKTTVLYDVPYQSQFASPEFAEHVLIDKFPAAEDLKWPTTGAVSASEYVTWVTTTCGMACTAMALRHFSQKDLPTITLARDAKKHGVYQDHNGHLSGMRYHEYVTWVSSYGLKGLLYRRLTVSGIRLLLSSGSLVIASVNPNIRGVSTVPTNQVGGHLILVVGYDATADTITIHNPSGFVSNLSHSFHTMSAKDFKVHFANRGIALSPIAP